MSYPPVSVRAATPELLADFLRFFDGEAFADNPKWGFCYCQFSYTDHTKVEWKERTRQENRQAACAGVSSNTMRGYLAYREGEPVGWCNAAPRTMLRAFDDEPVVDADLVGQVTCFIVAKAHRRTGVAKALLAAACAGFRSQNLQFIEATAYPAAKTDAQSHYGPLSMFLAVGFVEQSTDDEGYITLRLDMYNQPATQ